MANKKYQCKLKADKIQITENIYIRIPTVGEILDYEQIYYSITYNLTSSPYQQMVRLDDIGVDYTDISEWDLFMYNFSCYSNSISQMKLSLDNLYKNLDNLDSNKKEKSIIEIRNIESDLEEIIEGFKLIFGDLQIEGFGIHKDTLIDEVVLYNPYTNIKIDKLTHLEITKTIRELNFYEHVKSKPANESAKKYLLEQERKKIKRNSKKKYQPYLENLVIALVNTEKFKYNYETCMNLSLYKFNQSFKQIQHIINFENTMIGVYAGTVNTKEMKDKSILSWIQNK